MSSIQNIPNEKKKKTKKRKRTEIETNPSDHEDVYIPPKKKKKNSKEKSIDDSLLPDQPTAIENMSYDLDDDDNITKSSEKKYLKKKKSKSNYNDSRDLVNEQHELSKTEINYNNSPEKSKISKKKKNKKKFKESDSNEFAEFRSKIPVIPSCTKKVKLKKVVYGDLFLRLDERLADDIDYSIKPGEDYWKEKMKKYKFTKTEDEIEDLLDQKIERILDYFDRLENGRLTKEECVVKKPEHFNEPYLPTPSEIEVCS